MAKITPTISFTTNAYNATSNAGPGSVTLAAAIADTLDVDYQESRLIETSSTLDANANGANGPIDGSALATISGADSDGNDNVTAGTVGGFVFFKNNSTTTGENIFIAIVPAAGGQDPTDPAATGTGGTSTALDNDTHDTFRTMTLLPGEFAWFPWDYTGDIHWAAATGTPELEYWRWDRTT